ncbi:hypothetical protein [Spongiimicrobium salis]|uniref:hypothetical protein n=1 Tax=Spongiimicrobium salis TaxID=1667022 RepID=UPI00374D6792
MKLKAIIFALLLPIFATAQISFGNPDEGGIVSFKTSGSSSTAEKASGSPFVNETFLPGRVIVSGEVKAEGLLRYNAYRSEIEVKEGNDSSYSLLKRSYIYAEIKGKTYRIFRFMDGEVEKTSYFNPLNKGEVQLLFRPRIKLKRGRAAATTYDRNIPPKYITINSYFVKKGDKAAERVRLSKKDILKYLSDKSSEVKSYIADNKIKLKKEEDYIKVLDYYNSL